METLNLKISGMASAHCVGVVRNIIVRQDGVAIENIEFGQATVSYNPEKVKPETIIQEIEKMGYKVDQ
ncbi:heavy-metal-associated domain-containing protein [Pedobacter sp. PLR]|uniref:heavy-metal-associated domain-containing protein n=1 Tax=Pedobacter sp. PLR TaxID=2994465 RepID=UPI0022464381|nr:heavy-metal-associated domain-containing protein [Pedobacter sp. PLR]MCX2452015.1 heavy-metal-associated domain-containing protein [Pedobacter sp. PLR]